MPYRRVAEFIEMLTEWPILLWDEATVEEYERLRWLRNRIGTQDLKIAAIAIANDALLLSANLRDFERVPGLKVEDWLYS